MEVQVLHALARVAAAVAHHAEAALGDTFLMRDRPARPGDTLETEIRLKRKMANLYVCTGEARVNGELCSSGEFQFVVT